jgi:hypothetical protein
VGQHSFFAVKRPGEEQERCRDKRRHNEQLATRTDHPFFAILVQMFFIQLMTMFSSGCSSLSG